MVTSSKTTDLEDIVFDAVSGHSDIDETIKWIKEEIDIDATHEIIFASYFAWEIKAWLEIAYDTVKMDTDATGCNLDDDFLSLFDQFMTSSQSHLKVREQKPFPPSPNCQSQFVDVGVSEEDKKKLEEWT